jgi:FdrA protein
MSRAPPGPAVSATIVQSVLRRSVYYDSVTLMQVQQALRGLPGIVEAGVVMGTAANLELLRQAGLDPGALDASADDLVVAVRGDTGDHVAAALSALEGLLRRGAAGVHADEGYRPRSIATAARRLAGANLALISVAGRFAGGVAREALRTGLHVMLFSDNVALEEEVGLKRIAGAAGLLCMGPDCGTALIGGAALGFANRVRRGPIGLVAAAGTGLQEVMTVIHRLGGGISHAIGTGGRDLAAQVGGHTMLQGLDLLDRDPATTAIVLISKPPDPAVAEHLLDRAAAAGKPVVAAFVGADSGAPIAAGRIVAALTLEDAGRRALELSGTAAHEVEGSGEAWRRAARDRAEGASARLAQGQRYLRGLYSGGTLCAECIGLLQAAVRPVYSNVPSGAVRPLGPGPSRAHTLLDLGADEFTVGRLHPMLDMTLRAQRIAQEALDPEVAVILLDIVLGEGAHPDPAGALAPAIGEARRRAAVSGRELIVVASVCGTDEDPQDRAHQVRVLETAGTLVEGSNARASALAAAIVAAPEERGAILAAATGRHRSGGGGPWGEGRRPSRGPAHGVGALLAGPRVVNVGLPVFAASLRSQQVPVIDVDWRPPAGGDRAMLDLLARLE